MTSPISNQFRVFYDVQKNRYYRMNKATGQIEPSYRTGKVPAKFNPDVTGANYLKRKKHFSSNKFNSINTEIEDYANQRRRKQDTEISQKPNTKNDDIMLNLTEPYVQSRIADSKNRQSIDENRQKIRKEYKSVNSHRIKQVSEPRVKYEPINLAQQQSSSTILPKLQRKSSFSDLQPTNRKSLHNQPVYNTIDHDTSILSNSLNKNSKNHSFLNTMIKLNLNSPGNDSKTVTVSNSRLEMLKFQNKLKKYCEVEEMKLSQNHFQLGNASLAGSRLEKFTQKSITGSVLDDSHNTTLLQTNRLTNSIVSHQQNDLNMITKAQVLNNYDLLAKQRSNLLLLAKKCQQPSSQISKKLSQQKSTLSKQLQFHNLQSQHMLKQQLQKQKETFLSFYPKYVFKQNPRLIQQQKDRKINLKKLEKLYLDNCQRKYGRIYRSPSKNEDEIKEENQQPK